MTEGSMSSRSEPGNEAKRSGRNPCPIQARLPAPHEGGFQTV
jgi:hypothetical protein